MLHTAVVAAAAAAGAGSPRAEAVVVADRQGTVVERQSCHYTDAAALVGEAGAEEAGESSGWAAARPGAAAWLLLGFDSSTASKEVLVVALSGREFLCHFKL